MTSTPLELLDRLDYTETGGFPKKAIQEIIVRKEEMIPHLLDVLTSAHADPGAYVDGRKSMLCTYAAYPHHYGRKDPPMPVLEELAAFMADPATMELAIRRREDQRMVAEEFIRTHFLDLDCKTLRQETPHTLLCTKNDRSHQHEREWRKKDEIMLRELQKC